MPTLLDSVNSVLVSVGEREVKGVGAYHTVTAVQALEHAWSDLQNSVSSLFRVKAPSALWNVNKATVPGLVKLHEVTFQNYPLVLILNNSSPDLYPTEVEEGIPQIYYRIPFKDEVLVFPHPSVDDRPKVLFDYTRWVPVPNSDNVQWELPNPSVYPVLLRGATAYYCLEHLDDGGNYNLHYQAFQRGISQLIQQGNKPRNMYRRRR